MLYENNIFRVYDIDANEYTSKLTRTELLRYLEKRCINRSYNWPYSIKIGTERKIKNIARKEFAVRKEFDYSEEKRRIDNNYDMPYKPIT